MQGCRALLIGEKDKHKLRQRENGPLLPTTVVVSQPHAEARRTLDIKYLPYGLEYGMANHTNLPATIAMKPSFHSSDVLAATNNPHSCVLPTYYNRQIASRLHSLPPTQPITHMDYHHSSLPARHRHGLATASPCACRLPPAR